MTLSSEDYTNIWLRTKDRFLKWYFWLLSFTLAIGAVVGGFIGFTLAKYAIEPEVQRYVETETFRNLVADRVYSNLGDAEQRIQAIDAAVEDALESIRKIELDAFHIQPGYFSMLGNEGKRFTIQYGESPGGSVAFPIPFSDTPIVVVSDIGSLGRGVTVSPVDVNREGFLLTRPIIGSKVNWIAVSEERF